MVLGASEEAAALLVQQQGLVAAGAFQRKETQPMASSQLCQDPLALLIWAPPQHSPLPGKLPCPGHTPQGDLGLAMVLCPCRPLPQTCPTGLTGFTDPMLALHLSPHHPDTHPCVGPAPIPKPPSTQC